MERGVAKLRATITAIVETSESRPGRVFDWVVQSLILISLVSFSVGTLPQLSHEVRAILAGIEVGIVALFAIEYLLRLYVSVPTYRYPLSFFGVVDLLAVLPFLIGLGVDLRSVRVLRFFRLLRLLKLARYSAAARRFHVALGLAREEIVLFLGATIILLWLSACGIYLFENPAQPEAFSSVFACLWWAIATLTTVGYGDVYPVTVGGRLFTFCVLIVGLGVISVPAGLVASALGRARELEKGSDAGNS